MSGRFIAVAGTQWEICDDDGVTWSLSSTSPLNSGSGGIRAVIYSPERKTWVMVGDGGRVAVSTNGGSSFTEVAVDIFGAGEHCNAVIWCPGLDLFLFGGRDGSAASSSDLSTFTDHGSSGLSNINDGAWSETLGVAVFVGIFGGSTSGVTYTSNGSSYTGGSIAGIGAAMSCVAWADGPGVFVAGSDVSVYATSTNGSAWTKRTQSPSAVSDSREVCWDGDNSLVVLVGASGQIGTTPTPTNAASWTSRTSGAAVSLLAVARGDVNTVIGGVASTTLTSPTDVTWTSRTSNFGSSDFGDIAWGPPFAGGVRVRGYVIYR